MGTINVFDVVFIGVLVAIFLCNTCRCQKAIDLCKECLILLNTAAVGVMENSVKNLNTMVYDTLIRAYLIIGDYTQAMLYSKKLLVIARETGNRVLEGNQTLLLAAFYQRQGKFVEARDLYEKGINIIKETGDRKGETDAYCNFGTLFLFVGEYARAKDYLEKAIAMKIEIDDRKGLASCYINLGKVFKSLAEYVKAEECFEKALGIQIQTGDREGEGNAYENLGTIFIIRGEYLKAKEYLEKAFSIYLAIWYRVGIASAYGNLGAVFLCLGQYVKAEDYLQKALAINKEIGNRTGEADVYANLGTVFYKFREYAKAKEYCEKALAIKIEIGEREGEAAASANLGTVFQALGEYDKAEEYVEQALANIMERGDRSGQAASYLKEGQICMSRGDYASAEEFLEKALPISEDIGDGEMEFHCYCNLAMTKLFKRDKLGIQEAISCLRSCLKKCENLRGFLTDNDQFNVSFSDVHVYPYRELCKLFCFTGNTTEGLSVVELGRARALADLMTTQYSMEKQIPADPQPWFGRIERIMRKEYQSTCLYISYCTSTVTLFLWIIKANGDIYNREVEIDKYIVHDGSTQNLDDIFEESFSGFGILPEEDCEDRSLNSVLPKFISCQEESLGALRIVEENEDIQDHEPSLALYYKMIITPVVDLLEEPEIIIVPERSLYCVPFPALFETLSDGSVKYLSESYRIRIVPSLTTLELIQNSPKDYHSQTDELIVGDPEVGRVMYKGKIVNISRLYHAGKEAEMIGQLLGAKPLIGQHATKQAVLQRISSVRLVHVAAHGHAERGEIALAPLRTSNMIPQEEDYLLTMSDILQAQLHAKLVVLSCCHSGRGQIRAEGVVGIARAFLGSGARSVLVALWAISDIATKQFMSRFYEHLVRGESASESLHEAMKWMRANGYSDIGLWAPFMLIGDDVTFDFSN